ncbi:MAG TPA: flagellar biosynthetic protein FliO [Desulfomicrobiaceae bacterium]|jgi:flagellar protein FliO/FliZ|nr:flagellar biosynthetic protein FliO [Desulfomicrobiaceae bacterium]HCF05575.1 flagellar biosynthetic protein FliO [Desulfomicrobiaceae bacterium]
MDGQLGLAAVKMLLGLAGVVALLFAAVVVVRRLGIAPRGRRHGNLELVEVLPLGPRRQVAVVRFLDELLVLGVSEAGIGLLARRPQEDASHDDFANHLHAAAHRQSGHPDDPDTRAGG